jgi:hypothetical protein
MTVNIPAEVRWSLALAAKAELERAGRPLTAGELARHTGWSAWTAKKVVAGLRRDGLWPDLPAAAPVPAPADAPPPPEPIEERPDIATECAEIRRKWAASRWARQSGDRAPVRVARGIDHHQRLVTHKYR